MSHIRWSRVALADLERLLDFLEEAGSSAVQDARATILKDIQMLAEFPQMGRRADKFSPDVREIIIPFGRNGYVLRYSLKGDEVVITNLRHSREVGFYMRPKPHSLTDI